MKNFKTQVENEWRSDFGNEYNKRNNKPEYCIANNKALFEKVKNSGMKDIKSTIELGCGYGFALLALKEIFPDLKLTGVEINADACNNARNSNIEIYEESLLTFDTNKKYDLVLTKGTLMYINENQINEVYNKLYNLSSKFILIVEYFNPSLVEVSHRGVPFYKRDYCEKLIKLFPDLKLVDYGFVYHRDKFPQDDVNWFLLAK